MFFLWMQECLVLMKSIIHWDKWRVLVLPQCVVVKCSDGVACHFRLQWHRNAKQHYGMMCDMSMQC